jgi:myo-inositol-1(or 4)-monophosphatase
MYSELLPRVTQQVQATAYRILERQKELSAYAISDKGLNQLVSQVDIEAEEELVSALGGILPEAGFITEENTIAQSGQNNLNWIIDPLDGTTNFLHGLPMFSVSVALANGSDILLGIVVVPSLKETFTAVQGAGAHLNAAPIRVSETEKLSDSLLATGFPYTEFGQMDAYLATLHSYMRGTRGLRRMGSAAIDLVYTACGRFDGFFELGLAPWDVAAGALIVQEAGGRVCDFAGHNSFLFGKEIVANNTLIHEPMLRTIRAGFKL